MDDPVTEIRDVIRSITEPYSARVLAENVEKYFSEDAFLEHFIINQPRNAHGKDMIKGYYKLLRVGTINNKIQFHAVTFNENLTKAAIELTQHLNPRPLNFSCFRLHVRLIVLLELRRESDGKFRITRQQDNLPSDLARSGLALIPGSAFCSNVIKLSFGVIAGALGQFLLSKGWLGA